MIQMRVFIVLSLVCVFLMPAHATFATTVTKSRLQTAGWIPYWAAHDGIADAKKHLDSLNAIYPFVFTIKKDGTLKDLSIGTSTEWADLFAAARAQNIKVIPTISSGDGAMLNALLADSSLRKTHIDEIVRTVQEGGYDGIDIDYEGKTAESIDYFSSFLTELKKKLGNKTLVCTIEPRTPADSLSTATSTTHAYSNDYNVIKNVCDIIQIMAYDQQRADIKLNSARVGTPYFPVADTVWVNKVLILALQTLPKEKIMLGVPTYGKHVSITVSPHWFQSYARLGSINQQDALDLALKNNVKISRNDAGELSFTYLPSDTPKAVAKKILAKKVPAGTRPGMKVAQQALAYANETGKTVKVNMVWWSDAAAIVDKIALAKKYNLRGISIFKIDGNEDAPVWNFF